MIEITCSKLVVSFNLHILSLYILIHILALGSNISFSWGSLTKCGIQRRSGHSRIRGKGRFVTSFMCTNLRIAFFAVEKFSIDRVTKSGAIFDQTKLGYV